MFLRFSSLSFASFAVKGFSLASWIPASSKLNHQPTASLAIGACPERSRRAVKSFFSRPCIWFPPEEAASLSPRPPRIFSARSAL